MFKSISNLKKYVLGLATIGLLAVTSGTVYAAVTPGSIQYQGEDTPPLSEPGFNAYTGVPSVGNEADFVRVKEAGEGNSAYRNTIDTDCETGDVFNVWMYVHNGASVEGNNGGSGPSVARDVTARVDLDNDSAMSSFDITGFINSSNAGNLSDGAVINCGGKKFKLSYVENSAKAFLDLPNTTVNVPSAIVGSGTPIGTNALDGNVWGCWDQRVWLGLNVVVEEIKEEPKPAFSCDLLEVVKLGERRFKFTVKASATNTKITDYVFKATGPGNATFDEEGNTAVMTVDKHGEYTVTAQVVTEAGTTKVVDVCTRKVHTEKELEVVKEPRPKQLPVTGPGAAAGLFTVVTAVGTLGHRFLTGRKQQ